MFRSVVIVCVAAATWRAPVPWLHHHCQSARPEGKSQLALHLAVWHLGEATSGQWHLHFALLEDILRGGGDPVPRTDDQQQPAPDLMTGTEIAVELGPLHHLAWPTSAPEGIVILARPDAVHSTADRDALSRRQFLGDFAVARSLHSLLRIAQC